MSLTMSAISDLELLEKYKKWVQNGEIQFLHKKPERIEIILSLVDKIINDISTARGKGEISTNLDWADTHKIGRELWEKLASYALNDLDSDSKGNSELFKFQEAATEFEDILYGLDRYYRDHTLHSLWVYFIGEYILRELMPDIGNNLNWHLFNAIDKDKTSSPALIKQSIKKEEIIYKKVNKKKDAIWCLIALCHDLGYSISKLAKLNEKALNVLKFFDIPNLRHIGYSMDIEHQHLMNQFLELMSFDIIIVPSLSSNEEILVKCYRDDSTFWRLCRAMEKKKHGVYSSYLLYKKLGIFADTYMRGTADEWGLDDDEIEYNIIRGEILFSIAQHDFDFTHLNQLSSLADLLVIADELEEFSRFGRQMLSRKCFDTMANASIKLNKKCPHQGDDIEMYIEYEVADQMGLADFFKFKAERLCRIYSLGQPREEDKYCTIDKIRMTTRKAGKKLDFHLSKKEEETKGFLPETEIKHQFFKEGYYPMKCVDDKIVILIGTEQFTIDDWFQGVKDGWWKNNYNKKNI